jgi:hypothetical protein
MSNLRPNRVFVRGDLIAFADVEPFDLDTTFVVVHQIVQFRPIIAAHCADDIAPLPGDGQERLDSQLGDSE